MVRRPVLTCRRSAPTGNEMHPGIRIKLAVFLGTAILLDGMTAVTVQAASTMPTIMRPGDHTLELNLNGLKRHYVVHVPAAYDGKAPVPVVIMFHGGGGKARGAMQGARWAGKAG